MLGSLRILARNWTFDDVLEATGISRQVHQAFFARFVKYYAKEIAPLVITMPDPNDDDACSNNSLEYKAAGFTSLCVGSIDVVHVRQWRCRQNLKQLSTGKEKYPSRAYEVICNHRKKILHVTKGFYGSVNDKTIVRFDKAANDVKKGLYKQTTEVFDRNGSIKTMKGGFLICDNGYHHWATLMPPTKVALSDEEFKWSEMCESLRKDIECTFGILKQMFAILKYGCRCSEQEQIDKVFLTCCALYNQRLKRENGDEPWKNLQNELEDEDDVDIFRRIREQHRDVPQAAVGIPTDGSLLLDQNNTTSDTSMNKEVEVEFEIGHDERKKMLIDHFAYLMSKKQIYSV